MKVYQLLTLIAMSLIATSCEDLLTKNLDIEDDFGFEKQMVISGSLTAEADQIVLLVAENQSIVEPQNDPNYIEDATVTLSKDGEIVGTFFQDEDQFYKLDLTDWDEAWDGEYLIESSNDQYGTVIGSSTLPPHIVLTDLDIDEIQSGGGVFDDETQDYLVTFNIDDAPGKSFYRVEVVVEITDTFITEIDTFIDSFIFKPELFTTDQSGFSTWQDGLLINDDLFDGQDYTMNLNMSLSKWFFEESEFDFSDIQLHWYTMSEELYNFKRSYQQYIESTDFGPFQEPTSIYSNIENGAGYFGCENKSTYTFN